MSVKTIRASVTDVDIEAYRGDTFNKLFFRIKDVVEGEQVDELILTVVIGEALYGLDVDTSNIPGGTKVERVTDFQIEGNILTLNGIQYNTDELSLLGYEENVEEEI